MKKLAAAVIASSSLFATGCITTDATSLPFDVASTVGDAASSASSSGSGDSASLREAQAFVESQYEWIQQDAAKGKGENLAALAKLLGEEDSAKFSSWAQAHYSALFASNDSEQLIERIKSLQ